MKKIDVSRSLKQAQEAYLKGNDKVVVETLKPLVVQFKSDQQFLKLLSASALRGGDSEVAIEALECLVQLVPEDPEVNGALGDLYRRAGAFEAAYAFLIKSVEKAPDRPEFFYNLGLYMMDLGQFKRAEGLYRQALELRGHYAKAAFGLTNALEAQRDYFGAALVLDSMLVDRLSDPVVWFRLARIQFKIKQPEKAIESLLRTKGLTPEDPGIVVESVRLFLALGRVEDATSWLAECVDRGMLDRALYKLKASLAYELGSNGFLASYERLDYSSLPLDLQADYLNFLVSTGEYARAQQLIDLASGALLTDARDLMLAQLNLWNSTGCFSEMMQLIALQSDDYGEWLAVALMGQGHFAAAIEVIERLLDQDANQQYWLALLETALRIVDPEKHRRLFFDAVPFQVVDLGDSVGNAELFRLNTLLEVWLNDQHCFQRAPLGQSVLDGTQTAGNLFDLSFSPLNRLWRVLEQEILSFLQTTPGFGGVYFDGRKTGGVRLESSWSIKVAELGHHVPHVHSKGWLSCVYYVSVPEAIEQRNGENEGFLGLGRPGVTVPSHLAPSAFVEPKPGRLVVFPSYLWHETVAFIGKGERMVIAFDVLPSP
jgi:uncharacterized protein (TIGR02466 family)